jgi:hypothetical protein
MGMASVTPAWCLKLAADGKSAYSIVIGADATPPERFAAEELVSHLEQMSGAKLPIVTDAGAVPAHAILLGQNRYVKDNLLGVVVDWRQLGKEGCLLQTAGERLIIAGGYPRGTLYGVYALLEDYLGCRWFAPDTSVVPRRRTVSIPPINKIEQPAFEFREPWMYVHNLASAWWMKNFDPVYVARTRNSANQIHLHNIGKADFGGGGGRAGLNLHFANRIARWVEDEFPEARIGTFAYGATRR